jgi:protein-tyrosine-phosphatase
VPGPQEVPGTVLFACTMNAVRSPVAAAILAYLTNQRCTVFSAGVHEGRPDPFVAVVMDEIGIDVTDHEPQVFRALGDRTFDLIITLSPEAHHHALELTRVMAANVEYWPTLDPSTLPANAPRSKRINAYRHLRDELFARIKERFDLEGSPKV